MATKGAKGLVTNEYLDDAVDKVLKGMDRLLKEERKFNVENFATKEDLKRETSWIRNDINGLKADLSDTASRSEFNKFRSKVDKYLAG